MSSDQPAKSAARGRFIVNLASAALLAGFSTAGANAALITVGVGGGYDYTTLSAAVAAANPNDRIQVAAGTYTNDFSTINVPLTIEGVGGLAVLQATIQIPNGKGIFITNADLVVRNLEFRGAKVADENGAGIRAQSGDLVIEDSIFRENENGILAASNADSSITIRNSSFVDNGFGDGFTHAIYVNRIDTLIVSDSVFSGTKVGHDIKSRAGNTIITGNILDDGVSGTTSYAIDLPNGGAGVISGNTITQGANSENPAMIAFGAEGNLWADTSLLVTNNTFINHRPFSSVGVYNHTTIPVVLQNNTFIGVHTPLVGPGSNTSSAPEPSAAGMLSLLLSGLAGSRILYRRRRSH